MSHIYIDIHILQSVPPSNINRDDTGSPKTAIYGGVRRARVSSQAWKKATRSVFADTLDTSDLAMRTKHVFAQLSERAQAATSGLDAAQAERAAVAVLDKLKIKTAKKPPRKPADEETAGADAAHVNSQSSYLLFLSNGQLDHLAELVAREAEGEKVTKAEVVAAASSSKGVEVSLFGRMVADSKEINVDAAVQVAHALSTHSVEPEQDYFTAVDDLTPLDESGAGMLGTVEFNSSTLYRYATLSVSGLRQNLGDDEATLRAAMSFVESFSLSMPTGKQNTFANRTRPDAVVVMVRSGSPVNLVGAFEDAVTSSEGGWLRASATALAAHAEDVGRAFGDTPDRTLVMSSGERTAALERLGEVVTFPELLAGLRETLEAHLEKQ